MPTADAILLDETYALVTLSPSKILTIRVKKGVSLQDFKFAHEHALLFAKRENVRQIIIDESDLEQIGYRARAWLIFKQIPKVFMEFGLNMQVAVVRPSIGLTGLGNKALSLAYEKIKSNFRVEFFTQKEAAQYWIEHLPQVPSSQLNASNSSEEK